MGDGLKAAESPGLQRECASRSWPATAARLDDSQKTSDDDALHIAQVLYPLSLQRVLLKHGIVLIRSFGYGFGGIANRPVMWTKFTRIIHHVHAFGSYDATMLMDLSCTG